MFDGAGCGVLGGKVVVVVEVVVEVVVVLMLLACVLFADVEFLKYIPTVIKPLSTITPEIQPKKSRDFKIFFTIEKPCIEFVQGILVELYGKNHDRDRV